MRADALKDLADELDRGTAGVAVTITVPITTTALGDEQGPTRVRNAVKAATAALARRDVDPDERAALEERLAGLEAAIARDNGFARVHHGIACYVTPTITRIVALDRTPRERVIVNSRFWLAEAILDPHDDVDVVVLSSGGGSTPGARRYRLTDDAFTEVTDDLLPYEHDVRDHGERRKDEPPDAEQRDAYLDGFLNEVDHHLVGIDDGAHRPVVLVGVRHLLDRFRRVRSPELARRVVAEVDGNVDRAPDSDLARRVRDALDDARARAAAEAVAAFVETPPVRTAVGLDDVRALAADGRVHRLLVEEGAVDEDRDGDVVVEDRVAATVRAAHDAGAEVIAVAPGALGDKGPVVAIARW